MVKSLQLQPPFVRKAGATESDRIQSANAVDATRHAERRQILADGRAALHQRQSADTHKLVHQTIAGNEGAILNNDVAPEQRAVGDNHLTAHLRVVPHMTMRHEKIVRPDHRLLGFIVRAMQRDVFAEDVALANPQTCRLAFIFQILRRVPNHAARVKRIVRSNGCMSGQMRMRADPTVCADNHVLINQRIRLDAHGRIKLCLGMDDRCRVNHQV